MSSTCIYCGSITPFGGTPLEQMNKLDAVAHDNLTNRITKLEAERDRLRGLLLDRDGGAHDVDCKSRDHNNADGRRRFWCNCGHNAVQEYLKPTTPQPSPPEGLDEIP